MKLSFQIAFSISLFSLVACNSYQGDPYYSAWFNVYREPCSSSYGAPHPGCNYFANGTKIMAWQDPYGYQWQQGTYWTSPTGIWYDPSGYALNTAAQSEEPSTDVITQASEEHTEVVRIAGKSLSQEYALSEASGFQIAKSLQDWSSLGKRRARTEADVSDFSERLYGVKADKVELALARAEFSKNLQPIEELNLDVAAFWGTSPETSKVILKKWHQGELARILNKN